MLWGKTPHENSRHYFSFSLFVNKTRDNCQCDRDHWWWDVWRKKENYFNKDALSALFTDNLIFLFFWIEFSENILAFSLSQVKSHIKRHMDRYNMWFIFMSSCLVYITISAIRESRWGQLTGGICFADYLLYLLTLILNSSLSSLVIELWDIAKCELFLVTDYLHMSSGLVNNIGWLKPSGNSFRLFLNTWRNIHIPFELISAVEW